MKKQARFWHWHNGAVRIKINAGQTIRYSHGGATDEGYSWEAIEFSFDGATVSRECCERSQDCDGRYDRSGTSHCPADGLAAGNVDPDEPAIIYPAWQHGDYAQRDYSAEAMNY
jgi:hypothetical protein